MRLPGPHIGVDGLVGLPFCVLGGHQCLVVHVHSCHALGVLLLQPRLVLQVLGQLAVKTVHLGPQGTQRAVLRLQRAAKPSQVRLQPVLPQRILTDLIFHSTFSKVEWKIRSVIHDH